MQEWAEFYERLFHFREIRYFDIEGKLTGLKSKAMTSPCGKIRIPINESSDDRSQIQEYLDQYHGEGIQHIALHTGNIYGTVDSLRGKGVDKDDHEDKLLQIFTANVIGPIFFEIIQRKGNEGFGEGNFRALFESIEADQIARGVV